MKKLAIGLAALTAALAFSSCGNDMTNLIEPPQETGLAPPAGKTNTPITVTFKNGWEDTTLTDEDDEKFTTWKWYKPASPAEVYAVVDNAEMETYNNAAAEYKRIMKLWDDYNNALENNPSSPPPPPTKKYQLLSRRHLRPHSHTSRATSI